MPILSARDTIKKFNNVAQRNEETLKKNPYSDTYNLQRFDREATDYGRPPPGSKTEARGIKAGVHVCREILFLCETINANAQGEEPNRWVKFGPLFYTYSFYSDKLVGMLIRARKYGLVHFEGEMLYQRQDDEKIITMLMSMADIREGLTASGDPAKCISIKRKDSTETPAFVPRVVVVEKPKPARVQTDNVISRIEKFKVTTTDDPPEPAPEQRAKKPWTPKNASNAPVFCTGP